MFSRSLMCARSTLLKQPIMARIEHETKRNISTELTAALRPFYFAVHPDLFGQHPKQRSVNEDSLKHLSAHMESLHQHKFQVLRESKTLEFYIRDGDANARNNFKLIKIKLDANLYEPKQVVLHLLQLCNLPTDAVKNIKQDPVKTVVKSKAGVSEFRPGQDYQYGSEFAGFEMHFQQAKTQAATISVVTWIKRNAELAKERTKELAGFREEVSKLEQSVVDRLKLREVRYDCGWNIEHYRGCLKTLERLANQHAEQVSKLKNRVVVFAQFTGVSLEGHIMLCTGDVFSNWIDFIKHIPQHDEFLKKVPMYENTLAQVLRQIKIGRRKFMPKQQAREYASHLLKVTTTMGDYLTTKKYPKSWPLTLEDYEIVIESEAGPLMVNPTGQFIAPSTCPGFLLVDFITMNLELAKERTTKYMAQKHIERELVLRCKDKLKLKSLTKDDSVTPDKMIETIKELLLQAADNEQSFKDIDLHITNYYSVLGDGIVCIPWDFSSR